MLVSLFPAPELAPIIPGQLRGPLCGRATLPSPLKRSRPFGRVSLSPPVATLPPRSTWQPRTFAIAAPPSSIFILTTKPPKPPPPQCLSASVPQCLSASVPLPSNSTPVPSHPLSPPSCLSGTPHALRLPPCLRFALDSPFLFSLSSLYSSSHQCTKVLQPQTPSPNRARFAPRAGAPADVACA